MNPQVPIDVDEKTGVWTTDALPMLYVPRHFLVNNHEAVEQALGREAYAAILYAAGHKSAYYWCDREARQHGIRGVDVFAHYLTRISQRGWGQFSIAGIDPERATADIELRHSAFVLQAHEGRASAAICSRAGSPAPWIGCRSMRAPRCAPVAMRLCAPASMDRNTPACSTSGPCELAARAGPIHARANPGPAATGAGLPAATAPPSGCR